MPRHKSLFASETSQAAFNKKPVQSKSIGDYGNNKFYREIYKLGKGHYQFQITDAAGNGLDPPAYYKIIMDGVLLRKGGNFTHSEGTIFTVGPKVRTTSAILNDCFERISIDHENKSCSFSTFR